MSVNRFEDMPLMLCAAPDALMAANAATDRPVTTIVDIRQDWATENARVQAQAVLIHRAAGRMLLRISMPDDDSGQDAIERLAALRPDGFVLSGCASVADVQRLDVMLRVTEAECGLEAGSITILAEVGRMPGFFLSPESFRGISGRLNGFVLDGAALADATASQVINASANRTGAPLLYARAATILKARQAGLPCYELLAEQDPDDDGLLLLRDIAIADGFSGVIARNVAQLIALATG